MCRKRWILALMISLCTLTACGQSYIHDRHMDIYEKIHKYYSEMESYSANVAITAYSNKTENAYAASQKAVGSDKFYVKITDRGGGLSVTTVENSGSVKTSAEGSDYSVTVPNRESTGLLFVNRFFSKYYASEDTALVVNGGAGGDVTVLETELSENNPRISRAKLSVDNETLAPVEITLMDPGGNVVLKGEFSEFIYNDAIDPSIFSTEE